MQAFTPDPPAVLDEMFAAIEAAALASKPPPPAPEAEAATGKRRRAASLDETTAAGEASTEAAAAAAPDGAGAEGGVEDSSAPFRWKAAVLEALGREGRLKASKLRRLVCKGAVVAGVHASREAAEADFEKRLAKLVAKGAVSAVDDGKYIVVA